MTYDDDHVVLEFDGGTKRYALKQFGLEWPPPEEFTFLGIPMRRTRLSALTDEQRAGMTYVCRGAEYYPVNRTTSRRA